MGSLSSAYKTAKKSSSPTPPIKKKKLSGPSTAQRDEKRRFELGPIKYPDLCFR